MYPSIDLASALELVGGDTYRRGVAYAREGRVLRCQWDPDVHNLFGNVRGSQGRSYTTTVQLLPLDTATWSVGGGFCSCPVHVNCKHVAAIVIAAVGATKMRAQTTPPPSVPAAWRQSLDALLPPASTNDRIGTPLAIELILSLTGPSPTLDARLVRPGKRGGWVAGDLSWGKLHMLRYGYPDAQVQLLQQLYATYRASSSNSTGYYSYSYGRYTYGERRAPHCLASAQMCRTIVTCLRQARSFVPSSTGLMKRPSCYSGLRRSPVRLPSSSTASSRRWALRRHCVSKPTHISRQHFGQRRFARRKHSGMTTLKTSVGVFALRSSNSAMHYGISPKISRTTTTPQSAKYSPGPSRPSPPLKGLSQTCSAFPSASFNAGSLMTGLSLRPMMPRVSAWLDKS
jgi:hypothetical protein